MQREKDKTKKVDRKLKKRSIKIKLLILPIVIVVFAILALSGVSNKLIGKILTQQSKVNSEFVLREFVNRLEDNEMSLKTVNDLIENDIRGIGRAVFSMGDDISNDRLTQLAKDFNIDEINYFSPTGEILYSNMSGNLGAQLEDTHAISILQKSSENEIIEDMRKHTLTDTYYKYGAIKGRSNAVVQAGIIADTINALTQQFGYQRLIEDLAKDEQVVYALFIDPDLKAVAHSSVDRIGLDLSNDEGVINAVKNNELQADTHFYGDEKVEVYDVVYPVVLNGENVGAINIGLSRESIKAGVYNNVITMAITGLIAILLLGFILFTTSNDAVKTINILKEQMNLMAGGDFSQDVSENILKKTDEFGEISHSVNTMQDSIRLMIRSVLDKSQEVAAHSEELNATTEESVRAADEVSKAIEDIANGASEQAMDTEQGFMTVEELGNVVAENTNHIKNLNVSTSNVNHLKDEGLELINDLIEKTNINIKSSEEVKEVIRDTSLSAEKIVSASSMIKSIADQTNLLALNAAIEAARAGEAGRGFAVVADEIRKLAEQSNQFTEEIGSIVVELSAKTSMAVNTMDEVGKVIQSQGSSVNLTSEKFAGISDALEEMNNAINIVNNSNDEMIVQKEKIRGVMENLAAISEENAAGSQEASASVEEQTAAMTEISSASGELARIAEELNSLIEQFKI